MEYFGPFFPPGYFSGGYWGEGEAGGGPVYADAAATITASATVTATLQARPQERPVQGGWGFQDLEVARRVTRKAEEDRKRTREERKAAVLRAFEALDPKPVPVPTAATVERIAVKALDDLGIDRAAAELRRIEAMVRDLWQQRMVEIAREQEDEAIALLLLAA